MKGGEQKHTILFLPQKPLLTDGSLKQQVINCFVSSLLLLYAFDLYIAASCLDYLSTR